MNTWKKLTILCLFAFALITCKKETLQPGNSVGTPTFYFNGNVNGATVNLTAGVNNYYMYSSDTQDVNNVYHFIANLHPTNCSNCPNSIQFILNDDTNSSAGGNTPNINSSLKAAFYPFLTPTGGASSYKVSFHPYLNDTNYARVWYFGDGDSSRLLAPSHTYLLGNDYNVTLKVADPCNSVTTNGTDLGTPNAAMTNKIIVTNVFPGDSIALTTQITGGSAPYTYTWNFGDGSSSTLASPTHTYVGPGEYQIKATIKDANGLISYATKDTVTQGDTASYCIANFTSTIVPVLNPKALSNVTVIYTDGSGNVYSSANVTQSLASAFQITTVSSYENNINGQTTKMLHVKFNCQLKDAGGQTSTITNGDAVIAVAYK
jgi:PKD repeat protein